MNRRVVWMAAILCGALALGVVFWQSADNGAMVQTDSARYYVMPKPLVAAPLTDHNGEAFEISAFKGAWSVLFFGFTYCPDICPGTLAVMNGVAEALEAAGRTLDVYLVSFDPRRDTPERLATYVTYFNPAFKGLVGEKAAVNAFAVPFGAYYVVEYEHDGQTISLDMHTAIPETAQGYLINHTAWLYLISPDGRLYAALPTPHTEASLIADIQTLMADYVGDEAVKS